MTTIGKRFVWFDGTRDGVGVSRVDTILGTTPVAEGSETEGGAQ